MRRIVVFNNLSADGYFADRRGMLDWVVVDPEMNREVGAGRMGDFDTVLFGRKTYEMFAAFWPTAVTDRSSADPHSGSQLSPEARAMGVFLNEANKIVFTKTLKKADWRNTSIVPKLDVREIRKMKEQRGKDMIMFGSGSIITQLTANRLIDEYQFVVSPVILGAGRSMINDAKSKLPLELKDSKRYPSGVVILRYVPKRSNE